MAEEEKLTNGGSDVLKKHTGLRKFTIAVGIFAGMICVTFAGVLVYNNVSCATDEAFAKRIDAAIASGLAWAKEHSGEIAKLRNVGLIKMFAEIQALHPDPVVSDVVSAYLASPGRPRCWARLVDPNWPVDETELNITIKREYLDNKWVLYAIAPEKAKINPEQVGLFDPKRWQGRKLTHQLDALLMLRRTHGPSDKLNQLIEHLADRLSSQLVFDVAVVDIYIQKVAFILRAGFPEKIRRRWVERIIVNQTEDGGWNDRWFCFTSGPRPVFDLADPPSDQHATLQALTVLYLVRHGCPEHFGLE